ncbi:hypothetical protein M501DRAFT_985718 [Patellaria atrata CBS 101060]|uniref:DUF7025 domain-containing protein n=1 Tax=Patellaria atrata CBS 101060 TaxID=1346257 RepID=A0A9P4SJW5_9PEZI|nr:hypothetical protein M501DRAFT_985718 [Patellaria atrata CBS 101060]
MSAEAGLDESDQPRVESKIDDRMPNGLTDSRQAEDIPLPHDANARPIQRDPSQLSGSGRSGNVTPLTEIEYNDRNRPYNDRGRPYENRSPRPRVPKVVHKIEYRHVSSSAVVFEEESDRFAATKSPPEEPVLEVVTIAYTAIERAAYAFRDSVKPPPIHSMGYKYIQINSAAVINALRAVVEYYPGQNLIGDSITIHEPYLLLVHHLKELEEYRQIFAPENRVQNDEAEACVGEADTYEHLGIILDFLKDTQKDSLEKQKERHERERPVVTYELLWTLFKPGTDVFYDTDSCGTLDSYVVKSVHWKLSNGYPSRYEITLWNLDYDAVFIGPRNAVATVLPFEGEKEISSLDIFPCKYLREDIRGESLDAMTKRLEERGKMFFRLTQKQCLSYSGETTTFPRHKINGLVMVDAESFWGKVQAEKPPNVKIPPLLSEDVGERTIGGIPNCSCKRCKDLNDRNKRKSRFADYARINPLTVTELTPHQYFLCDRNVDGFHLKTRRWERLDAGCFSEPKFDTNMINELVIDDDIRTLLKNLSIKYTREVEEEDEKAGLWKSDFEQGKGEGMIVLLHGKPGVGKTYTAGMNISTHTAEATTSNMPQNA